MGETARNAPILLQISHFEAQGFDKKMHPWVPILLLSTLLCCFVIAILSDVPYNNSYYPGHTTNKYHSPNLIQAIFYSTLMYSENVSMHFESSAVRNITFRQTRRHLVDAVWPGSRYNAFQQPAYAQIIPPFQVSFNKIIACNPFVDSGSKKWLLLVEEIVFGRNENCKSDVVKAFLKRGFGRIDAIVKYQQGLITAYSAYFASITGLQGIAGNSPVLYRQDVALPLLPSYNQIANSKWTTEDVLRLIYLHDPTKFLENLSGAIPKFEIILNSEPPNLMLIAAPFFAPLIPGKPEALLYFINLDPTGLPQIPMLKVHPTEPAPDVLMQVFVPFCSSRLNDPKNYVKLAIPKRRLEPRKSFDPRMIVARLPVFLKHTEENVLAVLRAQNY